MAEQVHGSERDLKAEADIDNMRNTKQTETSGNRDLQEEELDFEFELEPNSKWDQPVWVAIRK